MKTYINRFSRTLFLGFSFVWYLLSACAQGTSDSITPWVPYDQSGMLQDVSDHETARMRFKLIQSKVSDKNIIWESIRADLKGYDQETYERLYPIIYEQDIPTIQSHIDRGDLSYEQLTLWYLYRIVKYENNPSTTLHTIISLNADAVEEARERDRNKGKKNHLIYGMPILLKDNINTTGMPTTAGAIILKDNHTGDATIVKRLKEKGAIILGKVNLSEWAYYFCGGCPVGYSAIGGQTLNPYGRGIYETGGSSAGSGTATTANYAVAAIGTETSGSILSPSGRNSVVGLKPTVGVLSRTGIVPISSTLDTPGPMTKNVTDNAILLSAMAGADSDDIATLNKLRDIDYISGLNKISLKGKRLGAIKRFMERDTVYRTVVNELKEWGATIIEYDPPQVSLEGFSTLLDADMKRDLPKYMVSQADKNIVFREVLDIILFNNQDSSLRAPYGQVRLEGSASDTLSDEGLASLAQSLETAGRSYFDIPMKAHQLDAILSVDNSSAGYAAAAKYPCLTIPMGYRTDGEPTNMTFIAPTESEAYLLQLGYAFEQATKRRRPPF